MVKRRSIIKPLPTVFIDSSVFFTATNSPTGGSAKVFSLSGKKFKLITSRVVLAETERNVRSKLYSFHLDRFFRLVELTLILDQLPDDELIQKAKKVIVEKDAVILAEAKQSRAAYLLTLDKKHFLHRKVKDFIQPTLVTTPKELLGSMA